MTRIFTEGFEMGDVLFFSTSTNLTIDSTTPRSGTYSARITYGSATKTITTASEGYLRFGIRSATWPNTEYGLLRIQNGTTIHMELRRNVSSGLLEIWQFGAARVGTAGTAALNTNTYYLIEIHWSIANAGGVFDVKVDGIQDVTFTGDTQNGATTTADNFVWFSVSNGTSVFLDDLAYNDTAGVVDNSWCGDGRIVAVFPNANGDVSQLAGSDGNSVDNYALVDDLPSNADTDYVSSGTAGQYDLYNMGAVTLPASTTIGRIYVESRSREELAGGDSINLGIKPSGGAEDWSGNLAQTTAYNRYVGKEYLSNPFDTQGWEEADINALQAGVKVV